MYMTPAIFTKDFEVPEGFIAIGEPTLDMIQVLDPETFKVVSREGYSYARLMARNSVHGSGTTDLKTMIWLTKEQSSHIHEHLPEIARPRFEIGYSGGATETEQDNGDRASR